jgi:hypothetical protein
MLRVLDPAMGAGIFSWRRAAIWATSSMRRAGAATSSRRQRRRRSLCPTRTRRSFGRSLGFQEARGGSPGCWRGAPRANAEPRAGRLGIFAGGRPRAEARGDPLPLWRRQKSPGRGAREALVMADGARRGAAAHVCGSPFDSRRFNRRAVLHQLATYPKSGDEVPEFRRASASRQLERGSRDARPGVERGRDAGRAGGRRGIPPAHGGDLGKWRRWARSSPLVPGSRDARNRKGRAGL